MRMTRTSRAIASSILRKLSACCWALLAKSRRSSFVETVDQFSDFGAEFLGELLLGDALVFDDVVEQGGRQRVDVELPARADLGDGDGMRDVGRAAGAELAQMSPVGVAVGFADLLDVLLVEVAGQHLGERGQRGDWRGGGVDGLAGDGGNRLGAWRYCCAGGPAAPRRAARPAAPTTRVSARECHAADPRVGIRSDLRSISTPVRPPAISRSAVTVGLSLLSRRGAWPWASSRAR